MNKKIFLYIVAIFFIGFSLRIIGLNFGLCSTTHTLATFHPDESINLYSLEKMEPRKFNFYPGDALFWGSFQVYLQGAVTKFIEIIGLVKINGRDFLKNNMHEADKLYIIVRLISILFGSFAILVFYRISRFYFQPNQSLIACLLFAVSYLPVLTSFYARPDSIMLFWGLVSVYYSLSILENGCLKHYLLSGIFIGLAASSKYNGVLFAGLLVIIHFYLAWKNKNIFLNFKRLIFAALCSLIVFVLVNPYSIIRFNDFSRYASGIASKGKWGENVLQGYIDYFSDTLPVSVGWPVLIMSMMGILISIKKPKNMEFPVLIFMLMYLITFAPPWGQALNYCLIAIPFLLIFAAKGFRIIPDGIFRKVLIIFTLLYTFTYTFYFKSFYLRKSTLESASEWILNNISQNSIIVISKNDNWTPPVIKQYEPPYKVLAGDSSQSPLSKAVMELEKIIPQGDYLVLTNHEYFHFLSRPQKYPQECRIINEIFQNYKEIKRFSRQPSIFVLPFGTKHLLEIMFGNPTIHIFKLK
jgi:hypothetical protein